MKWLFCRNSHNAYILFIPLTRVSTNAILKAIRIAVASDKVACMIRFYVDDVVKHVMYHAVCDFMIT